MELIAVRDTRQELRFDRAVGAAAPRGEGRFRAARDRMFCIRPKTGCAGRPA